MKIKTSDGDLEIEIVGSRPDNEPYIRIALRDDGDYLDAIDAREMRRLARLINKALGTP